MAGRFPVELTPRSVDQKKVPHQSTTPLFITGTWRDGMVEVSSWSPIGRYLEGVPAGPRRIVGHATRAAVRALVPGALSTDIISWGSRAEGAVILVVVPRMTDDWRVWLTLIPQDVDVHVFALLTRVGEPHVLVTGGTPLMEQS